MIDDESNREDAEQPTPEDEAGEPAPQEEPAAEQPAEPEEAAGEAEQPAAEGEEAEAAAQEGGAEGAEEPEADEGEGEEDEERRGDEPPGASLEPLRIEDEDLDPEERARLEAEAEERARREAEATADHEDEEPVARPAKVDLAPDTNIQATGKRKSAVARVIVRRGEGAFQINGRDLGEYFPRHLHQTIAKQPLVVTGFEGHVDVRVRAPSARSTRSFGPSSSAAVS
jgi:small subunit ribosomal protein S9